MDNKKSIQTSIEELESSIEDLQRCVRHLGRFVREDSLPDLELAMEAIRKEEEKNNGREAA